MFEITGTFTDIPGKTFRAYYTHEAMAHGIGEAISKNCKLRDLKVEKVDGRKIAAYTPEEAEVILTMALTGLPMITQQMLDTIRMCQRAKSALKHSNASAQSRALLEVQNILNGYLADFPPE